MNKKSEVSPLQIDYSIKPGDKVKKRSNKPFKSGVIINTVKGLVEHQQLKIPAFTFEEDDSIVEARRCIKVENEK